MERRDSLRYLLIVAAEIRHGKVHCNIKVSEVRPMGQNNVIVGRKKVFRRSLTLTVQLQVSGL